MVRYILQRSDGLRLGKDSLWTAECKNIFYQSEHQDIVLNKLIELNAKDINLRAKVTSIDLDSSDNSETAA
jgi:hypothetical protein